MNYHVMLASSSEFCIFSSSSSSCSSINFLIRRIHSRDFCIGNDVSSSASPLTETNGSLWNDYNNSSRKTWEKITTILWLCYEVLDVTASLVSTAIRSSFVLITYYSYTISRVPPASQASSGLYHPSLIGENVTQRLFGLPGSTQAAAMTRSQGKI